MSKVPFYRPSIGEEEIAEVVATLKSGWLTTGPRTKQFEQDFARYLGHKHAVAVNSCTAALHLALEAIGLKPGQGVIVPTLTFAATAEVVRYLGGHPILADCRAADFNLDVADAERRLEAALGQGREVVAIIPMEYGGQIGDMAGVQALARRYHLKIVEDAAHCCPAYYRDEPGPGPVEAAGTPVTGQAGWRTVGTGVDCSCFSFYANKAITTGEGGMVCTESDEYADRMRLMSLHGISRDAWKRYTDEGSWYYEIVAPGFKYNLPDLAAALGIHQLRKAARFHQRRCEVAEQYRALLGDVEELLLPSTQPGRIHSWHLYAIRLRLGRLSLDRARFIAELQQHGIGASVHWMPLHLHPYYRETFGYAPGDLPLANALYPELVSLPIYPDLGDAEVRFVCDTIKSLLARALRGGSGRPAGSGASTVAPAP